jgi:hypothetical protein
MQSLLLLPTAACRDGPSELWKQTDDAIWQLDAAWGLPEALQLCHLLCMPCYAGTPHNTTLAVPAHIICLLLLLLTAACRDGPSQLLKQSDDAIWELDAAWGLPEALQLLEAQLPGAAAVKPGVNCRGMFATPQRPAVPAGEVGCCFGAWLECFCSPAAAAVKPGVNCRGMFAAPNRPAVPAGEVGCCFGASSPLPVRGWRCMSAIYSMHAILRDWFICPDR